MDESGESMRICENGFERERRRRTRIDWKICIAREEEKEEEEERKDERTDED